MPSEVLSFLQRGSVIILLLLGCMQSFAHDQADTLNTQGLVFVEGRDSLGRMISRCPGILLKKGYVAVNYHAVVGKPQIVVSIKGETASYRADGYLTVEEKKDIIILSVPGLQGTAARLINGVLPPEGGQVFIPDLQNNNQLRYVKGKVSGSKEILDIQLPQLISADARECIAGPVFANGEVVAFATAGYWDNSYFTFVIPASEILRIQNRSFIIKDIASLPDSLPMKQSHFQGALMESLTSILWKPLDDAMQFAARKQKKVVIHVFTDWAGWCKVMDQNTWNRKNIIRYVNENYCCVRLDAETHETLQFLGKSYDYMPSLRVNQLAWSLLNGNMEFPSTVLLDEKGNVLSVIPGYMDAGRMDAVLHYFSENAHLRPAANFLDYEVEYMRRERP